MASYYNRKPGSVKYAQGFVTLERQTLRRLAGIALTYTWSTAVFRDGYRLKDNFLWADFVGFDVDNKPGDHPYSLAQAVRDWCDSEVVIMTTKSHQKWKEKNPPADRFRIITPWEKRITEIGLFEANYRHVLKGNPAFDKSCVDCSRQFFPGSEIVYANFDGYRQPVHEGLRSPPPARENLDLAAYRLSRGRAAYPAHIQAFIKLGKPFGGGRNPSVYVTARTMLEAGTEPQDIIDVLKKSPFDRNDFPDSEIETTVWNAVKGLARDLTK